MCSVSKWLFFRVKIITLSSFMRVPLLKLIDSIFVCFVVMSCCNWSKELLLSFLLELRCVIFWKNYIFYVIHSYISKTIVIFVSNLEGEEKAFHDYYASNDPKYEKTYYSLPWGSWIIYTYSAYTKHWGWLWNRFQIVLRVRQIQVHYLVR